MPRYFWVFDTSDPTGILRAPHPSLPEQSTRNRTRPLEDVSIASSSDSCGQPRPDHSPPDHPSPATHHPDRGHSGGSRPHRPPDAAGHERSSPVAPPDPTPPDPPDQRPREHRPPTGPQPGLLAPKV